MFGALVPVALFAAALAFSGEPVATKQIDPCSFASAAILKTVLQAGLAAKLPGTFPYEADNGGSHFSLANPNVEQVTCPHMTITMTADVKYWETRGFPRISTSGRAEFRSLIVANVLYRPPETAPPAPGPVPVTRANFVSATLAITDINVTALKLDKAPRWLNQNWIRKCLNGKYFYCPNLVHDVSFDVTPIVRLFQNFGSL